LPSFDTAVNTDWNEPLLADYTAVTSAFASSSQMCECVSQIVELAAVEELLRHVVLQPQHLWNLHLDRHLTSNITKEVVLRGIDLVRLLDRSVIKPENDIAVITILVIKVWPSDRNRLVRVVSEDCERACSVEANTSNGALIDVVLVHCSADRGANASPDVRCGLFLYSISDCSPKPHLDLGIVT
jgi:hypothetical protein